MENRKIVAEASFSLLLILLDSYLGAEWREIIQITGKDPVHSGLVTWHFGQKSPNPVNLCHCSSEMK